MKVKYILEITDPNDSDCMLDSFEGDTPFGSMSVGDELTLDRFAGKYKIIGVWHILCTAGDSHILDKIVISVEQIVH